MCGKVLPTSDTICKACDLELTNSAPISEENKSFTALHDRGNSCPSCNNYISKFEQVLYPEKAPWYKFQRTLPRCPVCKATLCKKYETKAYRRIYLIIWLIWLLFQFIHINQWTLLARYIFGAIVLCYITIILYRSYRDPVKYVINE